MIPFTNNILSTRIFYGNDYFLPSVSAAAAHDDDDEILLENNNMELFCAEQTQMNGATVGRIIMFHHTFLPV